MRPIALAHGCAILAGIGAAALGIALLVAPVRGLAQPLPKPLPLQSSVADKNFYPLQLLQRLSATTPFPGEPALADAAAAYRVRLAAALDACGEAASCYLAAARWTDAEVQAVEAFLQDLCAPATRHCERVVAPLRASGALALYRSQGDAELLVTAWRQSSAAIGRILAVYGDGTPPRYPAIDAMAHDPQSPGFARLLRTSLQVVLETPRNGLSLIADAEKFALLLLAIAGRDEAGRFEPLEQGENAAAYRHLASISWRRFPYSAILIPGQGLDDDSIPLAAGGRLRLELSVARFRAGLAPLLIVSGGYVHPNRTRYCEAIEMKRALIADYAIPPEAILVEPHARHTTTNLRNAVRLIYRYGMPFEKPVLIVTDEQQAAYIASAGFDERNRRETGVIPYTGKRQLSPLTVEFLPALDALQQWPEDPLDP